LLVLLLLLNLRRLLLLPQTPAAPSQALLTQLAL
jgi:hypothetical protein